MTGRHTRGRERQGHALYSMRRVMVCVTVCLAWKGATLLTHAEMQARKPAKPPRPSRGQLARRSKQAERFLTRKPASACVVVRLLHEWWSRRNSPAGSVIDTVENDEARYCRIVCIFRPSKIQIPCVVRTHSVAVVELEPPVYSQIRSDCLWLAVKFFFFCCCWSVYSSLIGLLPK
jgi:hypothetical protein